MTDFTVLVHPAKKSKWVFNFFVLGVLHFRDYLNLK